MLDHRKPANRWCVRNAEEFEDFFLSHDIFLHVVGLKISQYDDVSCMSVMSRQHLLLWALCMVYI